MIRTDHIITGVVEVFDDDWAEVRLDGKEKVADFIAKREYVNLADWPPKTGDVVTIQRAKPMPSYPESTWITRPTK